MQGGKLSTHESPAGDFLLAPVLLLAAVVDALCATVCLRIPLRVVSPYLFIAVALVILILIFRKTLARVFEPRIALSLLVLFLLILFQLRTYWTSCSISDEVIPTADAWSYCSFGKYLWENSRGVDAGLPIVDEYASHLKDTRFAASGLLAFLSLGFRPGDPASAIAAFIVICCVAMFLALFYFCSSLGLSTEISLAAALLGAAWGWVGDAVLVGNLDNVLFLPFLITFMGAAVRFVIAPNARSVILPLALCGSAAVYCYPEGFILGMVVGLPVLLGVAFESRSRKKAVILATSAVTCIILASPYLPIAAHFLQSQFATTGLKVRPGEMYFPGLLHMNTSLPAAYGLGDEYQAEFSIRDWLLGSGLFVLLVIGFRQLRETFWPLPACLLPMSALVLWQGLERYNYGLYKVLFISLFVIIPLTAVGLARIVEYVRWKPRILLIGAAVCIVLVVSFVRNAHHLTDSWRGYGCNTGIRDLASLRFVAHNKSIIVDISNDVFQLWGVYYMRDVNIILREPVSYLAMPHIQPFLARARNVESYPVVGRLHEGSDPDAIWSDGTFSLVKVDAAQILDIANPNGLETMAGQPFLWIGPKPAVLRVSVPKDGPYLIRASSFIPGPSIPGRTARLISVEVGSESRSLTVDPKTSGIPVRLQKGENEIRLRGLDTPTIAKLPNGDTRPLLLGITGIFISPDSQ